MAVKKNDSVSCASVAKTEWELGYQQFISQFQVGPETSPEKKTGRSQSFVQAFSGEWHRLKQSRIGLHPECFSLTVSLL
jgi:hypothetical protein